MTLYQWNGMELAGTNGMYRCPKSPPYSRYIITHDPCQKKALTNLQLGRYNSIILPPTMLCVKMSLLLLYLRIFSPDKVTRYLIYVGMTFCIGAYITIMFVTIFTNVIILIAANKTLGVVNFTSDVYILFVPLTVVSKLQLSTKKKIGFMMVFMTGIMSVQCYLRTYYGRH